MKKAFFDIFVVNNIICPNRIIFCLIYPLAELSQCVLDSANRSVINVVEVLHGGERTDFADYPGKQPRRLLGVVPANHELVAHLRVVRLNPVPRLCERNESRPPFLLVTPVWHLHSDVGGLKQVKLR